MLTLRLHNHKPLPHGWAVVVAVLLLLGVVGFAAGHNHWSIAGVPTPAYVSHTSSLIGTADGTLLEGSGAVAAPPVVAAFPAFALLVIALGSLLRVALLLTRLYTRPDSAGP